MKEKNVSEVIGQFNVRERRGRRMAMLVDLDLNRVRKICLEEGFFSFIEAFSTDQYRPFVVTRGA